MKRDDVLKEMKECIGTQEPVVFFEKMVDVLNLLFVQLDSMKSQIDFLTQENKQLKIQTALSIQWEPKLASTMLTEMIAKLRLDKETYHEELTKLKTAFIDDKVTQNYNDFCNFWQDTLGYHPFLEYK